MTPQEKLFIGRGVESIEEMARFFVNEPDEEFMLTALSETRQNLAIELTGLFGTEGAAQFADQFVATVVSRRCELLRN
jgi:hypothetical protein